MDTVKVYLNELGTEPSSETILRLLSLNPEQNPWILRLNLADLVTDEQISGAVSTFNDEWLAFNELVISFVKFANQLDPWSILKSFDMYTTFLNDLSIAFNNSNRGSMLSQLVINTVNIVLPWALKLDYQLFYQEFCTRPRLTYLASILLKIFNNIRSQINDPNQKDKKSIILFTSNKLCFVYFKLSNPLLCRNVFSNMNNANLQFKSFKLIEQVQYRYFLGKYYLIKDQLNDSLANFLWCLEQCPLASQSNAMKILENLLPVSLVLGKNPNFNYISQTFPLSNQAEFVKIYHQLHTQIKSGNIEQYFEVVNQHQQYLKQRNVLLMLSNKSKILLLRNLVKKIWIIRGRPSSLDYDDIIAGLRVSGGTHIKQFINEIDDFIIENIFISLIDENLLRGKIFPRLRKIALSKTNTFNKVDEIYYTRFSYHHSDQWMNQ